MRSTQEMLLGSVAGELLGRAQKWAVEALVSPVASPWTVDKAEEALDAERGVETPERVVVAFQTQRGGGGGGDDALTTGRLTRALLRGGTPRFGLRELAVRACRLSDADAAVLSVALRDDVLPSLRVLDLSDNLIENEGAAVLGDALASGHTRHDPPARVLSTWSLANNQISRAQFVIVPLIVGAVRELVMTGNPLCLAEGEFDEPDEDFARAMVASPLRGDVAVRTSWWGWQWPSRMRRINAWRRGRYALLAWLCVPLRPLVSTTPGDEHPPPKQQLF